MPDHIIEVDPSTDSIVWEWHVWDHLIQDYDPEKENYGVPSEHPELVDINGDREPIEVDEEELERLKAIGYVPADAQPFTSLIGIVLAKRRRYGGYLIHMAVAVMFVGFAGKAFGTEKDFTLYKPGIIAARMNADVNPLSHDAAVLECASGAASDCVFVKGYMFRYDRFIRCPDLEGDPFCADVNGDHKTTWTGQVRVWTKEGDFVGLMEPARWRYAKLPDQPTTEPSIQFHGFDVGFHFRRGGAWFASASSPSPCRLASRSSGRECACAGDRPAAIPSRR